MTTWHDINDGNNKVCVHPWRSAYITTSGDVLPCCLTAANHWNKQDHNVKYSLSDSSLEDIRNSDKWNQLRKDLLAGIENPTCEFCWQKERQGLKSNRHINNQLHTDILNDITFNLDGTLDNNDIGYWDVRGTNLCNMKCIMCDAGLSSLWNEEALKNKNNPDYNFRYLGDKAVIYANDRSKEPLESILERHIDKAQQFYFAGGEPLISPIHWHILEMLVERKMFHVKLTYNTNLLKLQYGKWNALKMWENFDEVNICASLDAVGRRAEYSRTGTVWSTIDKNFREIMQQRPTQTGLNPTLSILTVGGMNELLDWADDCNVNPNRIKLDNVLVAPRWLNTDILPNQTRQEYWKKFEHQAKKCGNWSVMEQRLQADINEHTQKENRLNFKRHIQSLDNVRNANILEACTDLTEFWNSI
jgi:MoaA/NifB/PqqE/SkfB family radical SAM enzyme